MPEVSNMSGWIDRITSGNPKSAGQAKERLKLVLIHDRTDLSPESINNMKNELIQVIARYVDIDPASVRISMNQEGREQRLVADIPILASHKRKIG
jgi:cell division topological specificity factor